MRIPGPGGFSSTRFPSTPGRACRALILALLASSPCHAVADEVKVWATGAYSFSDELGGFRITGASGIGTKDDPLVITEELNSATPVTLTIRTTKPIQAFGRAGEFANGIMYMRIDALNNSGQAWIEFQFELQEILDQPSVFGDGLSFDQRNKTPDNIWSSNFADFDRDFEPYDRLLFKNGKVDPLKTASFEFLMTDYTPRWTFYLVQDPRIPTG
ncbi:hypothetical protein LB516_05860 [Mesorhizobium sp. CO1-1-7]|uniref:hypothetical protein n=1 Tax=Mesorhizobium sp. CO1-1-7 TaxID=2876632 RepID=UPI001CD11EF2|nr:hypothetical protein [Mesorhizobium sp. CO1-1-7]MBZ9744767.1 hypothetical protein [Mesorhizobium sp. CO1-1-7]